MKVPVVKLWGFYSVRCKVLEKYCGSCSIQGSARSLAMVGGSWLARSLLTCVGIFFAIIESHGSAVLWNRASLVELAGKVIFPRFVILAPVRLLSPPLR